MPIRTKPKPKIKNALSPTAVRAANTGIQIPPTDWAKAAASAADLAEDCEVLEGILRAAGIEVRTPTNVITMGLVTGRIETLDRLRNTGLHPQVAAKNRAHWRLYLEYLLGPDPEGLRYAVVTSGQPVPLDGDLDSRTEDFHRTISKLAYCARRDFGVDILLRSSEVTYKTSRGAHLHANLLYRSIVGTVIHWPVFMDFVARFMGSYCSDRGPVQSLDAALAYVLKPPVPVKDLLACTDRDAAIPWLFRSLFGKHLITPLGSLKQRAARHRAAGVKLAKVREFDAAGRETWRIRVVEKNAIEGGPAAPCPTDAREPDQPKRRTAAVSQNFLLCRTLPVPRFTPWFEPMAVIANYRPHPTTVDGLESLLILEQWKAQARADWDRNRAPDPETALGIASLYDGTFDLVLYNTTTVQNPPPSSSGPKPDTERIVDPPDKILTDLSFDLEDWVPEGFTLEPPPEVEWENRCPSIGSGP